MNRTCLSIAVVLVLFGAAAALPTPLIASAAAAAANATSRCVSRDVRAVFSLTVFDFATYMAAP